MSSKKKTKPNKKVMKYCVINPCTPKGFTAQRGYAPPRKKWD